MSVSTRRPVPLLPQRCVVFGSALCRPLMRKVHCECIPRSKACCSPSMVHLLLRSVWQVRSVQRQQYECSKYDSLRCLSSRSPCQLFVAAPTLTTHENCTLSQNSNRNNNCLYKVTRHWLFAICTDRSIDLFRFVHWTVKMSFVIVSASDVLYGPTALSTEDSVLHEQLSTSVNNCLTISRRRRRRESREHSVSCFQFRFVWFTFVDRNWIIPLFQIEGWQAW